MSDTQADLPTRVAVLEQIARTTLATLERLDRRIELQSELMEKRFEQQAVVMERRMNRMDDRMDRLETAMTSQFRWLLGTIFGLAGLTVTGFGALLGVVAHGFHWI